MTIHRTYLVEPPRAPAIGVRDPVGKAVAGQRLTRAATRSVTFDFVPAAGAQCGPYEVTLTRRPGVSDRRILSATRGLRGNHVVIEVENATASASRGILKDSRASVGKAIRALASGDLFALKFRPPATGDYVMYLRARPAGSVRSLRVGLKPVDPSGPALPSFNAVLKSSSSYAVLPVRKGAPPWTARLTGGRTYELTSPWVDMIVLTTDTRRAPTEAELCAPGS